MIDVQPLQGLLLNQRYLALGTSDSDGPWTTPLVYGIDRDLAFYWASGKDTRHSRSVSPSGRASAAVFDGSQTPNSDIQGIYLTLDVEELSDPDGVASGVHAFYRWRYPDPSAFRSKVRPATDFSGVSPRRLYRAVIASAWALDPSGHPEHGSLLDHRIPVDLAVGWHASFDTRIR